MYLGAPNIAKYAPAPNAFVNAQDFAGPEELADHLHLLDRNDTLYQSYFTWRCAMREGRRAMALHCCWLRCGAGRTRRGGETRVFSPALLIESRGSVCFTWCHAVVVLWLWLPCALWCWACERGVGQSRMCCVLECCHAVRETLDGAM